MLSLVLKIDLIKLPTITIRSLFDQAAIPMDVDMEVLIQLQYTLEHTGLFFYRLLRNIETIGRLKPVVLPVRFIVITK